MRPSRLLQLLAVFMLISSVSAAQKKTTKPAVQPKEAAAQPSAKPQPVPLKKLLFFMNPHGSPCQRQYAILESLKDSLKGVAEVEFIQTTVENDLGRFSEYGIRGLPSLVITDHSGKETYRFSPGIQSGANILLALKKK